MPPSKGKKPSKPSSSPSPSKAVADPDEDEALLRSLLSRASAKFPSLISESALVGSIVDSEDASSDRQRAKVWLSEAAMVSSSILPASLVTVSLPASARAHSDGSPLDAFANRLSGDLGDDLAAIPQSEAGRYFAIATVFPSRKVQKNGVRLSYSLYLTMGFPANGRSLYISSIKSPNEVCKQISCNPRFCLCYELYLKLVPLNTERIVAGGTPASVMPAEASPVLSKVGSSSSPRTPSSYKSKLTSPRASPLPPSGKLELVTDASTELDSFFKMIVEDEKIREILKIYLCRWLCGRHLLVGNLISLLVSGRLCVFLVEAFKSSDIACKENHDQLSYGNKITNSVEGNDAVLLVDPATEVTIIEPTMTLTDNSMNPYPCMDRPPSKEGTKIVRGALPRIGGLIKEFAILKQIINFSLMHKGSPLRYKGVLLHGPPGTGKTSLATTCARDAGANLFVINGPEVVSEYYGESEQTLSNIFDSARKATPAVVFIDELDALAPARKDGGEELSLRMLATLLTLMDGIHETDGVLVIAATNRPDCIDPALRRPGRLDKEIEIGVPSPDQRLEILRTLLDEMHHSLNEEDIRNLALGTHGFVGADLAALCNEAGMIALRRYIKIKSSDSLSVKYQNGDPYFVGGPPNIPLSVVQNVDSLSCMEEDDAVLLSLTQLTLSSDICSPCPRKALDTDGSLHDMTTQGACDVIEETLLRITADDLENAKMKVRPSAMREVMLELPKVSWEDVGGQAEVKKQLIEAVQWPQMCPEAFKRIGIRPPRGLLLFGPPGCSKTLMARAVASEAKLNFLAVKGPELFSKWVGESEKAVKSLFAKARVNAPSIIFFDEIDGLAITRGHDHDGTSVGDRVLSQLLVELDGLDQRSGVTVIAATNRPDKIDPALLRPGRFDRHLDVKPPDARDREAIFYVHMRNMPCSFDVTAKDLACLTEGYTGADIKLVCREAAIAALEESLEISEISMRHFRVGIGRVHPSDVQFYLMIAEKFKRYVDSSDSGDQ